MTEATIGTILIAGDQLLREGLKQLSTGIGLVTLAEGVAINDILEKPDPDLQPDLIVLLDWQVGDTAFMESLQKLRERYSTARIVVLSEIADGRALLEALNAGVDGYLHRNMTSAALLHSIRLVMLGEAVFPGKLAMRLLSEEAMPVGRRPTPSGGAGLSPRETDILSLLAEGQPNKVIANHLGTTEATVKVQLRRILRKIGAQNRTQAAIWALGYLGRDRNGKAGAVQ